MRCIISSRTEISIHAPREGGDIDADSWYGVFPISIHAPREGGDGDQGRRRCAVLNFNPRPPRGGRRRFQRQNLYDAWISIHAPREGGDPQT